MSAHVAIVAGAGGALGHATTAALAGSGLTVVAADRNEQALHELPGGVRPEVADTTDPAAAKRLIDRIAGEVGPPDVLVNTIGASRPGVEPTGGMAAYSTSKAALVQLTRILDVELRSHGIRENAVAPQLLDTPENRATFPAEVMKHAVAPEAIADVIAFLVSDTAAPVSGAILPAYGA
jgi:NAD(P)-dependent dehydrogenase (short-subunit alcohol dehydrogenase family)